MYLPILIFMIRNSRKLLLVFFFTLFTFKVSAPVSPSFSITGVSPEEPFRRLIHAIGMVETGFDTLAYNPLEQAAGCFQIRPIRLEDYNRRTGKNYTMNDLYNYDISEKIFLYYASKAGPYNFESIARNWNGSGEKTIQYWNKVKEYL